MNIFKELRKLYRNRKYEQTPTGVLFMPATIELRREMTHWTGKCSLSEATDAITDPNRVVNQGLDHILDGILSNGTVFPNWYIAPYKNNYTPQAGDTGLDFPTAGKSNEATTEYSEPSRVLWVDAGPASQVISNTASPAIFTFTTTVNIFGAFMVSGSTKGATSNTLLAGSLFTSVRPMDNGSQLNIVYQFTIADV